MFTNADCTVYLYCRENLIPAENLYPSDIEYPCIYSKHGHYIRLPIHDVYWEDVQHSTFMKTGQRDACSVLLVIPRDSLDEPIKFTQGKDLVVKGIVMDEIDCSDQKSMSESLAALKFAYDYQMIVSVDERLYGNEAIQHYELACK